ncbi:hypothetical protein NDU88_006835 [Pleurodeles waltl]|uniref:Uncharacterized protein n=1 Tax=Pleurodeles waltl TaxID=8319 RepID=A0AAV7RT11_PLEWA|nr:hypothetical protein NDU88_006835 [Pleurodeles waltl]
MQKEDAKEPSGEQRMKAKSRAGHEQEEEEMSRLHYPQDEKADTGTENEEVPEICCEDWWNSPVEVPEPARTLESWLAFNLKELVPLCIRRCHRSLWTTVICPQI